MRTTSIRTAAFRAICAGMALLVASTALAQNRPPQSSSPVTAIVAGSDNEPVTDTARTAGRIKDWRWSDGRYVESGATVGAPVSRIRRVRNGSRADRIAKQITAGVALGVVGFLTGGLIGASLDRHCGCDDPGLRGFIIGAPVGAVAGAIAGVMSVR